ncbi:MAG: putative addiction module antidote protein [Desulfovibrionaceae bacterium]|jgi:probable addiction module antidote protein|nr:putative addiction module antidote protein [Desulfovibrionaceae bacterium]
MDKKIKVSDLPVFDAAQYLDSDEMIAAYLAVSMEDDDPAELVRALGTVARARGMTQLARETGLAREALYRSLSADGNPSFATITKVMHTLGLKLVPQPIAAH